MLWGIHRLQKIFSPNNVRSEFYAYFYPLVFCGGQLSMIITAELAYYYNWQYMYYLIVILLLIAIIFVLCFFTYLHRPIYMHFKRADWKSIPLAAGVMLMTIYLFTYGRTLGLVRIRPATSLCNIDTFAVLSFHTKAER